MQILHLDSGRDMRGGQWQVLSLLERLGEGNLLLARPEGQLMQVAKQRGLEVRPMSPITIASPPRTFDIIHAHDARSHTWAAALSTTPLVVSRRVAFPPKNSLLSRWKYGKARHYLAVSEFVKRTLIDAHVPENRITVVYDGVRVPETAARGRRIIAPATDDPAKGSDLVREAAKVGGFEVHFSKALEQDLPGAALLIYVTRSEGLGSAALMAMAYGVPVVASRVGGLPEIVIDGKTGFLAANEPRSIADAVQRAMAMSESLGANARAAVLDRFTAAHMVEGTKGVYEKVTECRKSS